MLLAAPTFSSDYQTKADDIQRCTRYGRRRLAATRLTVMFFISAATVAAGTAVYLFLMKSIFGAECMKNSIQMVYSAVSLPDMNLGQMLLVGAGVGFLTIIAAVLCTLVISSFFSYFVLLVLYNIYNSYGLIIAFIVRISH